MISSTAVPKKLAVGTAWFFHYYFFAPQSHSAQNLYCRQYRVGKKTWRPVGPPSRPGCRATSRGVAGEGADWTQKIERNRMRLLSLSQSLKQRSCLFEADFLGLYHRRLAHGAKKKGKQNRAVPTASFLGTAVCKYRRLASAPVVHFL